MLTLENIKRTCSEPVFHQAETLCEQGAVKDLTVSRDQTSGLVDIEADVTVGRRSYHVYVCINETLGFIFDTDCTCTLGSECPHIAAVLLQYLKESAKEEEAPEKERGSDETIVHLLERIEQAPVDLRSATNVMLVPYVSADQRDPEALHCEFRIGRSENKMYVLPNITAFINLINTHGYHRYGRELEFIHDLSAFHRTCRRLVVFLRSLVNKEDTFRSISAFPGYYGNDYEIGRSLCLRGRYLDAFMEAAQELDLHVMHAEEYGYAGDIIYHKKEGLPDLHASMKQTDGGWLLSSSSLRMFKGSQQLYIFDGTKPVYYVSQRTSEKLVALLDYMQAAGKNAQYISSSDLPAFARDLYPLLESHTAFTANGFDPAKYLPDKPDFEIYLDAPDKDVITAELYAIYPSNRYNVFAGIQAQGRRSIADEKQMDAFVSQWFNAYDPIHKQMTLANDEEKLYELLQEGIHAMQEKAKVFVSDTLKKLTIRKVGKITVGVSVNDSDDLLQLNIGSATMKPEEIAEILSHYDRKKKFFRLKSGEFIDLDDGGQFDEFANLANSLQLKKSEIENGSVEVGKYRAMYLEEESRETSLEIDRDAKFRSLIANIRSTDIDDYEPPKRLESIMRDYQKEGFRWLSALYHNGFGALLADEMGLGKTLQVLSFLDANKGFGKTLVVCPASLVYNWYQEVQKFAPDLKAVTIIGAAAEREDAMKQADKADILITSYNLLKKDMEFYQDKTFTAEIIDEAQYIKNAGTMASKAVKDINAKFRIALTGTPIENRLSELWSIFDFIMPGFFFSYHRFRSTFELPIIRDKDTYAEVMLQKMIRPFVLRRLKKDVLKDLPDKMEEVYYANADTEQKQLYDARVQQIRYALKNTTDEQFRHQHIEILSELTHLREICCDPALLYDNYTGGSAKEELCLDLIKNATEAGHKVLLFSQFTSMLAILTKRLKEENIAYHLLTGATNAKERAEMVDAFQKDDVPVFAISLKAGGTGLNLTAADIVIHYDPWWNTAVQNQASDRAHRIGQKNIVSVYRLILKDTIEERILKLQEDKADLAGRMLDGKEMSRAGFTREELLSLLD